MKGTKFIIGLLTLALGMVASTVLADENPIDLKQSQKAWVAWAEAEGTVPVILAATWEGKKWSQPYHVSSDHRDNIAPSVAIDPQGNPWVVWSGRDGLESSLYYSRFDGEKWTKEQLLTPVDNRDDVTPAIAFNAKGEALVVWGSVDGVSSEIHLKEWDGKRWLKVQTLTQKDLTPDMVPAVAFSPKGKGVVAWVGFDQTGVNRLYSAWQNAKGEWNPEQLVGIGNPGFGEDLPTLKLESGSLRLYFEQDNQYFASSWTGKKWTRKKQVDLNNQYYDLLASIPGHTGGRAWFAWTDRKGTSATYRYNIVTHDVMIGKASNAKQFLSYKSSLDEMWSFLEWSLGESEVFAGGKKKSSSSGPFTKAAAGDSITAGSAGVSWVGYWDADVAIAAQGGLRATAALGSKIRSGVPEGTDVLVILAGTNDVGDGRSGADIVNALNSGATIATDKGVGTTYICTGIPRQDSFASRVEGLAQDIRSGSAVPFIETYSPLATDPASFTVDKVGHLNETGAQTVGAIVKKAAKPR